MDAEAPLSLSALHRQQGLARRHALLLLSAVAATGAGLYLGVRQHGAQQSDAAPEADPSADTTQARSSAPAGEAPLLAADGTLSPAFWEQVFDRPDGGALSLGQYRHKPLLINFWATWCPPCVKEMPELDRFARDFAPQGWRVLGLAVDAPTPVKQFMSKVRVGFDIGLAGFGGTELSQWLGNQSGGLPFTVLIDAQGRLRHRKMGATRHAELAAWARAIKAG